MSTMRSSGLRKTMRVLCLLVTLLCCKVKSEDRKKPLILSLQHRLAQDMGEVLSDMKIVIGRMDSLEARMDASEKNANAQMETMKKINAQMETRMDASEKNTKAHIDAMERNINTRLETRMDTMEKNTKAHIHAMERNINTRLDSLEDMTKAQMDTMQSQQEDMTSKIDMLLPQTLCENRAQDFGIIPVECDNLGWMTIQRRVDNAHNFTTRNWTDYKTGFGDRANSFWLGLETIHRLTFIGSTSLRVELESFEGETRHATYSSFRVDGEAEGYRLHISGYAGTAGDGMRKNDGMKFSTVDQDQDTHSSSNCAEALGGGWWYNRCGFAFLNSEYSPTGNCSSQVCMDWFHWLGWKRSYKKVAMKLRFV